MSDMGDESGALDTSAVMAALSGEPTNDEPVVDPGAVTEPVTEQPTTPDDLGPDPDLSDLDPAQRAFLEQRIQQLRGDYTRKTTEIAPIRQLLEQAGDPQAIQDAWEFAQALQNDPTVRAQLFAALQAEAGNSTTQEPVAPEDPFSDYDLPPEIRDRLTRVDALDQRLAAFEQHQAQAAAEQQQQAYIQEVAGDLTKQWDSITTTYPDLLGETREEADAIEEEVFALGAHTNGNLAEAVDLYRRIENRAQARLFKGSAHVPGGSVAPPAGGGHSTEPVEISTFKDAGAAAVEYLRAAMQDQ